MPALIVRETMWLRPLRAIIRMQPTVDRTNALVRSMRIEKFEVGFAMTRNLNLPDLG